MTRIKICGITTTEDALFVTRCGVDYLGFIFYRKSARYIPPVRAAGIVHQVRAFMGVQSPRFVGVFVDTPVQDVVKIRELVGLDLVQMHGSETPEKLKCLQPGAFKAIQPALLANAQALAAKYIANVSADDDTPQILVDAYHPTEKGGTGHLVELDIAMWLSTHYRLVLAGGLNPENVISIVEIVKPWGVDVSSGVEIIRDGKPVKGCKDPCKVQAFTQAVRRVDHNRSQ